MQPIVVSKSLPMQAVKRQHRGIEMARQMLQICHSCGIYTLKAECPNCGDKVVQAAAIKWSPEDQRAHLRRQLNGVEEEGWSGTLPTLHDSEE